MAYDLLTSISQDADERARYRARRKFQMDLQHNQIISFEDGERKAKLDIAHNMLASGVSLDVVVQCTGLSPDEIQASGN
jgi:predicted transposase/invertase (TIGR01784 family)